MTTFYETVVRCSVCSEENEFLGLNSTNAFGSPDLDTRPPEMQRSTMHLWVRCCPNCGYCARDLGESCPCAMDLVGSEQYQEQLNDPGHPELADSFLCKAMVDRECKNFAEAAWAFMHAAWDCDDSHYTIQARMCRREAAALAKTAGEYAQKLYAQNGADKVIRVDLLRRSGQLDEARELITTHRKWIEDEVLGRILDFQISLLDCEDLSCHTIAEALESVG